MNACLVTSINVVDQSFSTPLAGQFYIVPTASSFAYNVKAVQTPACGYSVAAWAVSVSSGNNPSKVASFTGITATGLDDLATSTAGPFGDTSEVGLFTV